MRHSVRVGEYVYVSFFDAFDGRYTIAPFPVRSVLVGGVEFTVLGGARFYTTDEGLKWCRDDPEDLAAFQAYIAMAP